MTEYRPTPPSTLVQAMSPVVVDPFLPYYPDHREDARRIVRHGMADILRWLGEEIGPKPGEPVSCLLVDGRWHVSEQVAQQLRERVEQHEPRRAPVKPEPKPDPVPKWLRTAMCGKKSRYSTHEKAVGAATSRVVNRRGARMLRVYACPLCHGFHLTHKTPEQVGSLVEMADRLLKGGAS